jgi:hypothetical protein
MGLADKITSAANSEGGVYLGLGEYDCTVSKIIHKATTANSGECIIAELQVDKSNNEAHPAGSKRSSVFKLSTTWGLSGAKMFFYAVMGAKTDEQRAQADNAMRTVLADLEAGKPCPLNGRPVKITVAPHTTKDKRESSKTIFAAI